MTVSQVMAEIRKDIVFYDQSGGGATFSGGEPVMQPEFLLALLERCRAEGIRTAVDTTCYAEPEVIARIAQVADLFLCDVKHMDATTHRLHTGVGNEPILENLRALAATGRAMIVRIPVIPGFNDDQANVTATAKFVDSLKTVRRVDLLPYNRGGVEKAARLTGRPDLIEAETPGEDRMEAVAAAFRAYGFDVSTGG
jgi:pyruvate formate lyase activating enzyme